MSVRGRRIHLDAVRWLKNKGYDVPEGIVKDLIRYFGGKITETDYYAVVSLGALGDYKDHVAHEIHEIVEVVETKKKYKVIDDLMKMREIGAYAYAHPIAAEWENKYFREIGRKERPV